MNKVLLTVAGGLGGAFIVFGWLHFSNVFSFRDILTSHDEPVIIENGPIRINFSPRDKEDDVGRLINDGRYFVRHLIDPVKIVRMWRQGRDTGGQYQEIMCGGDTCKVKGDSIVIGLLNGQRLAFSWTQKDHTPIGMYGGDHRFDAIQGIPYQIEAQDKTLRVATVTFDGAPDDKPITVRQFPDDIVVVKLCVKKGNRYCADHPLVEEP